MLRAGLVTFLLLAPASLVAQESPSLTERDFLDAIERSPRIAATLSEDRERAAADALRAALLSNPSLDANIEDVDGAPRETSLGVRWTPPLDRRRALRREVAEKNLAVAEARLAAARFRLRLGLRATYAAWAFAWERRELLAARLSQVGGLAGKERARAEAGEIAGLAARRLTLEEAQASAELARAEAALAATRAEAAAWYPDLAGDAHPGSLPLPPPSLPSIELAGTPDLTAREREIERAEALRRLAGGIYEAPELGIGWKRIEDRSFQASGPVLSASWTVPLFERRQADRKEAEARLAAAQADLELFRARAEAERSGALAAFRLLVAEAGAAERAAGGVNDLVTGAAASYQLGEAGLTDFLDTLRAALAARLSALEIREAAWAAQRQLESASGRPLLGELP